MWLGFPLGRHGPLSSLSGCVGLWSTTAPLDARGKYVCEPDQTHVSHVLPGCASLSAAHKTVAARSGDSSRESSLRGRRLGLVEVEATRERAQEARACPAVPMHVCCRCDRCSCVPRLALDALTSVQLGQLEVEATRRRKSRSRGRASMRTRRPRAHSSRRSRQTNSTISQNSWSSSAPSCAAVGAVGVSSQ